MILAPFAQTLLLPFSILYGIVVRLRAGLYRCGLFSQKKLEEPVISVGNLTVGGTGKTPMVICLSERLLERGKSVGILSRGYRGESEDASGQILSDETWMMKRRLGGTVRLGIGADRYLRGLILERQGIEWFLLDDGYQHLQLARDVNILLIDATDPFGGGRLIPSGRLREPKSAARRADLVVITRSQHAPAVEAVVRRYSEAPIFYAQTELKDIVPGENTRVDSHPNEWRGKKIFLFCAVGNASAFFEDAQHWEMEIVGQRPFPDHHRFRMEDVASIERQALGAGAYALLCTEKDSYNLRGCHFQRLPQYVCRINLRLADEAGFWRVLDNVVERKRGGAAQ